MGWENKSKHVQSCLHHALDREVSFSRCSAGTLGWRAGRACVLCIDTSRNWSGFSAHISTLLLHLWLWEEKRRETHPGRFPMVGNWKREKEKSHVRHHCLHVHYNTGFGCTITLYFSTRQLLCSVCMKQN